MNIEIDFEVFQELTSKRKSEEDGYNEVIRRLLKLPEKLGGMGSSPDNSGWVSKGYHFPEGTEFKAEFRGMEYFAAIKGGKFIYDGVSYSSFSGAAKAITGSQRNGWDFWSQKQPGGRWKRLY